MSVKKYGIYIAYPPTVDLRAEGLGRLMASFLKASLDKPAIRFVIACPSWTKESLIQLCESESIALDTFEIISVRTPLLLRFYLMLLWLRRERIGRRLTGKILRETDRVRLMIRRHVVKTPNLLFLLPLIILYLPFAFVMVVKTVVQKNARRISRIKPLIKKQLRRSAKMNFYVAKIQALPKEPKNSGLVVRLYRRMSDKQVGTLVGRINRRRDIHAWYAPTAFWPEFCRIRGPRLVCVPDVVLQDFPVAFACIGGERFLYTFDRVCQTIGQSSHFVTYSAHVKWETLVHRYNKRPEQVHTIYHAANRLDPWVNVSGFPDANLASRRYCQLLWPAILNKSTYPNYMAGFQNNEVSYLFYASQFRPNKNIMNLLRAYRYMLRERYLPHKLFLTGNPDSLPEIKEYVQTHRLEQDVIFLRNLTSQELAACYKLAHLAVNPSFSEGGCPFTFTEALSVGTPVVMARIPVTTELLTDPSLDTMFFDPYHWRDMADRIEWAVAHRDALYQQQKPVYEQLAARRWSHVVDEHITLLDALSHGEPA